MHSDSLFSVISALLHKCYSGKDWSANKSISFPVQYTIKTRRDDNMSLHIFIIQDAFVIIINHCFKFFTWFHRSSLPLITKPHVRSLLLTLYPITSNQFSCVPKTGIPQQNNNVAINTTSPVLPRTQHQIALLTLRIFLLQIFSQLSLSSVQDSKTF